MANKKPTEIRFWKGFHDLASVKVDETEPNQAVGFGEFCAPKGQERENEGGEFAIIYDVHTKALRVYHWSKQYGWNQMESFNLKELLMLKKLSGSDL